VIDANNATPCSRLLHGGDLFAFVGPLDAVGVHRHAAAALLIAPEAPFRIRLAGGGWTRAHGAIIPSRVAHALDCGGQRLAVVYFDPLVHGPLADARLRLDGASADWVRTGRAAIAAWLDHPATAPFDDRCRAALGAILPRAGAALSRPPGARLTALRAALAAEADWALSLNDVARHAGLSRFRFSHLFSERVGLGWTAYRNWMRLIAASAAIGDVGSSLTTVALDAGFNSSAHFAAAFRAAFGITPSQLRGRRPQLSLLRGAADGSPMPPANF
jgi:AraC-like DNA-binding protein